MSPWDIKKLRRDFPALHQKIHGKPLIYLDNAATTQKPRPVIDAVTRFYELDNANVHRAIYELGERATQAYEAARQKVAAFINVPDWHSIVFTRGATEAINLVAYAWGRYSLGPGDEILVTEMEHHSNLIPWQLAARDTGATLRYVPLKENGTLQIEALDDVLTARTKLVAVVHKSNVLGTVNPVREIVQRARELGALVLLDGAQSVPHFQVNVQELDCDFLAFSGHKMLGPTGVGVLYGRPELLESMEPFQGGGEMISMVSMEQATWNDIPWKFEAGTPNIAQAVGLGAAIDYLEKLGMDRIEDYMHQLTDYARGVLSQLQGLTLYGQDSNSSSAIAFNLEGVHPHDLSQLLDQEGIAVRAGHHCAQPLTHRLGVSATTRASLYVYNTPDEIDRLAEGIERVRTFLGV
ncbi:MAG: cysteine desulfurase [Fidelibacterota bacterium]|nr:MAG: cysteine desulfurase [Candidatus Neomarinimicrobiota bacterium]